MVAKITFFLYQEVQKVVLRANKKPPQNQFLTPPHLHLCASRAEPAPCCTQSQPCTDSLWVSARLYPTRPPLPPLRHIQPKHKGRHRASAPLSEQALCAAGTRWATKRRAGTFACAMPRREERPAWWWELGYDKNMVWLCFLQFEFGKVSALRGRVLSRYAHECLLG